MKKPFLAFFLIISLSQNVYALEKKNSIYLGYGGPFFVTVYEFDTLTIGYIREINDDLAISINTSLIYSYPSITNYSLYYYMFSVPYGNNITSTYFSLTYGDIALNMFNQGIHGFQLGVGFRNNYKNYISYFESLYLIGIDPIYTFNGSKFRISGGIGVRF